MKVMLFIYGSFYKFAKALGGNDPEESSKLYFVWVFVTFSIPILGYLLYSIIGKGKFWLWIILCIGYCLAMNYMLRKLFINKIAIVYNKKSEYSATKNNALLSIILSIILLFGSVLLGFFIVHLF